MQGDHLLHTMDTLGGFNSLSEHKAKKGWRKYNLTHLQGRAAPRYYHFLEPEAENRTYL